MSEICLVHMPFSQLGHPSMALSVLAAECRAENLDVEVLYYKPKFHHVYTIPSFHIMLNFFYFTSSIYTIKSRLHQGVRGDGRGSKPV